MTTGRINQVTTFHPHTPPLGDVMPDIHSCSKLLSQSGVHQRLMVTSLTATAKECSQAWLANGQLSFKVDKVKLILSPEISQVSDTFPLVI